MRVVSLRRQSRQLGASIDVVLLEKDALFEGSQL